MSDASFDALQQELVRVRAQVEALAASRARTRRVVLSVVVAGLALSATWSFAAPFVCGTLPYGLQCFVPGTPAIAPDLNGNFKIVSDLLDGGQVATNSLAGRIAVLEGKAATLEAREVVLSGEIIFQAGSLGTTGSCGDTTGSACVITFPAPSPFTQAPRCVFSMNSPDGSGYREVVVTYAVSTTSARVWKGVQTAGSTMRLTYVCSGH